MTHAIFETGGKQYRVKEGDELYIEKLDGEDSTKIKFDKVLAILSEEGSKIGSPYIQGATVTAKIIKSGKAKKIIVYKMKRRKGYRRKQGHRQPYTKIEIENIAVSADSSKPTAEPKTEKKPEPKTKPKTEPKAKPKAEPKAKPKVEPKAKPKVEPETELKTEPKPAPVEE